MPAPSVAKTIASENALIASQDFWGDATKRLTPSIERICVSSPLILRQLQGEQLASAIGLYSSKIGSHLLLQDTWLEASSIAVSIHFLQKEAEMLLSLTAWFCSCCLVVSFQYAYFLMFVFHVLTLMFVFHVLTFFHVFLYFHVLNSF